MANQPLPPDPASVEKWRALPQNKPSRDALPPMTGGLRTSRALLFGFGIVLLLALIVQLLAGR
ncbi:MAG: hypothetical protein ABI835_11785 [Chloroflexota bacterium]